MRQGVAILGIVLLSFLTGCQDKELDALMDDYCTCIAESRNDADKIGECIEKMDAIRARYEAQPQKLVKVLEKTSECD